MPRPLRIAPPGIVQHVVTRAIDGKQLFESRDEFEVFEDLLERALGRFPVEVFGYGLLPNHVHVICRPLNYGGLSHLLKDVKQRFARQWRARRHSTGRGHVFQGRFSSHLVQTDPYFLTLARYVARNPVHHGYADDPGEWNWTQDGQSTPTRNAPARFLAPWPVAVPPDWAQWIRTPLTAHELEKIQESIRSSQPLGTEDWVRRKGGHVRRAG